MRSCNGEKSHSGCAESTILLPCRPCPSLALPAKNSAKSSKIISGNSTRLTEIGPKYQKRWPFAELFGDGCGLNLRHDEVAPNPRYLSLGLIHLASGRAVGILVWIDDLSGL